MSARNSAATQVAQHELLITRIFDAPRELVFQAWTKPEHQARWMGPKDFTVPSCKMDFRIGGAYRTCIISPDGSEYWMRGIYREIVEPERIVFTFSWEEEGERGMETLVTLIFTEHEGKTKLKFRQTPFQSIAERDSHSEGWNECFDRLAAFVTSETILVNRARRLS